MSPNPRSLLILGGGGRLASSVGPAFEAAGWTVASLDRRTLDITDRAAVDAAVVAHRPTAILNTAAWTDPDACERDPAGARRVNATGVGYLRDAAGSVGAHLCHISTDYVFDGAKATPYTELDAARPLSTYGTTKLEGEHQAGPAASVLRVAWVSGRTGRSLVRSAVDAALDPARRLRYVTDQLGSPTVGEDIAPVIVRAVEERVAGVFHVVNEGQTSPWELARWVVRVAGGDPERVEPVTRAEMATVDGAVRPQQSALANTKAVREIGVPLRPWREAVADLVVDLLGADRAR